MASSKGARAERELVEMLWRLGFAVVRSAGSGQSYAPDVVAIKNGCVLAFECKAWRGSELRIEHHQMDKMMEWCRRSGAELYIAWRMPYRGWIFIPVYLLSKRGDVYVIKKEEAEALGIRDVPCGGWDSNPRRD